MGQHEAADIPNLVHIDITKWKITMLFRGKLTFPMAMAFNSKVLAITISGRRMSPQGIKGFDDLRPEEISGITGIWTGGLTTCQQWR